VHAAAEFGRDLRLWGEQIFVWTATTLSVPNSRYNFTHMQFSVPQFIDVEDKIVGPFTGKQTIMLMLGGGVLLMAFTLFNTIFFILVACLVLPLTLGFVFYKPQGMPMSKYLGNILDFLTTEHLYVWRREPVISVYKAVQKKRGGNETPLKVVSRSRIRDLANLLDTSAAIDVPYEMETRPDEEAFRQ
jgi:hypothetical protein